MIEILTLCVSVLILVGVAVLVFRKAPTPPVSQDRKREAVVRLLQTTAGQDRVRQRLEARRRRPQ